MIALHGDCHRILIIQFHLRIVSISVERAPFQARFYVTKNNYLALCPSICLSSQHHQQQQSANNVRFYRSQRTLLLFSFFFFVVIFNWSTRNQLRASRKLNKPFLDECSFFVSLLMCRPQASLNLLCFYSQFVALNNYLVNTRHGWMGFYLLRKRSIGKSWLYKSLSAFVEKKW